MRHPGFSVHKIYVLIVRPDNLAFMFSLTQAQYELKLVRGTARVSSDNLTHQAMSASIRPGQYRLLRIFDPKQHSYLAFHTIIN
jgi:hypothetical protein